MPWKTVLNPSGDTSSAFLVSDQAALMLDCEWGRPCAHDQREIFEIAVGLTQRPHYELCKECGILFKAISKKRITKNLAFFDHVAAQNRFSIIRYERRIAIVKDDAAKNGHPVRERKYNYSAYLRSPEWYEKRKRVLLRAKFICEMCHKEEATEAHHRTYDRIFFEKLDDLVAVCASCHSLSHSDAGACYRLPRRRSLEKLSCTSCRWFDGSNTCMFYEMPVGAALSHSESCGAERRGFEELC